MKVTRYFQSCLLIEEGEARLLIDPSAADAERAASFGLVDAVLYTHEHSDHFDAGLAASFANKKADIYANASTAKQMTIAPNIVKDGDELDIKGVSIKALELPHCLMIDGSEGPQNTGYLIAGKLFHPGDGKELAGLQVENLAVPISGPDVSLKDACSFINQVGAKRAVPIHYDLIGTKPEVFQSFSGFFNQTYKVEILGIGESLEL
jgi:L-ascorbate metabolism protein UlaG (beta-lactamase superfamily)